MASVQASSSAPALRDTLREATAEAHERLHGHPGLTAVAQGQIGRSDYRALLRRLYGFYGPIEAALGVAPERTQRLESDLCVLGDAPSVVGARPRCARIPSLGAEPRRLGCLYVLEGAALGGRALARGLDRLLGAEVSAGRSFFIGRGAKTGAAWRTFLSRLNEVRRGEESEAVDAAIATFAAFELWLADWRDAG